MSSRETIFGKIRSALAPLPEKAAYPAYDRAIAEPVWLAAETDLPTLFARRLTLTGGVALADVSALSAWLQEQGARCIYVDPSLRDLAAPLAGAFRLVHEYAREAVDEIDTALTIATGGIAETGTIVLTDGDTPDRLAALAPWRHVAVLARNQIFRTIGDALDQMPSDPGVIWVTGPSKTADVEGILIQGVHGPGVQACLLL